MQITSREINAKTAPKRFNDKYRDIGTIALTKQCDDLNNLTPITADAVDKIIGHSKFTETKCNECGSVNRPVVHFNCAHTSTYDLWICIDCVKTACMRLISVDE